MTLVLLSGGLDSAVLLSYIGNQGGLPGEVVVPVHIRCGYAWELAEADRRREADAQELRDWYDFGDSENEVERLEAFLADRHTRLAAVSCP